MSVAPIELLRAAASGDLNRLRALLAQGVDVNSTNKANQTALMLAVAFKQIEIVKYLVLLGADVTIRDEQGLTASDWARHDTRIIKLLNAPPVNAVRQESLVQTRVTTRLGGLAGAIVRDHISVNSGETLVIAELASVASEQRQVNLNAETQGRGENAQVRSTDCTDYADRPVDGTLGHARAELIDGTVAPQVTPRAPNAWSDLRKTAQRVDISLPNVPPKSAAMRTFFRVSIVVLLFVFGFGTYHFMTSLVSTRTSRGVKPEPASQPVSAATTPTKSDPAVGGDLAGTELFLPDADYPPAATVASGNITVGIQVSQKGIVVKAEALDGDESLRSAAEKAALRSAFAPEKLKDKGELIDGTITYNFLKPNNSLPPPEQDFGFITDVVTRKDVSASAGGPLAGAERKLVIPKIPKSLRVDQESATVVVRVNRAGRVMSWRPLDGEEKFRAYLIKAARDSTFDPGKLPGEGNVVGFITYRFQ